jgi:2'-5' RNA ligase
MPNWFIALPVRGEGWWAELPPAPAGLRIFAASDLHITVAFLGDVGESRARMAFELASEWPADPIAFSLGEVRPLGSPRRPSALSALVDEGGPALSRGIELCRDEMLEAAGARPDTRPPLPHATLARIRRKASNAQRRRALEWASTPGFPRPSLLADRIALFTWSRERSRRLFDIVALRDLGLEPSPLR